MSLYDGQEEEVPLTSTPSVPRPDAELGIERMEAEVTLRAIQVIGDEPEAMRWLGTPIRALNYATPVSLLYTVAGRDAVLTVLGRLEHGIL
jgi:putative toxin-antitoxin system antitoxin component (TIGR02293 family)